MKDGIKKIISYNIKYHRQAAGMSQKELAEKVGVAKSAVSNWEAGQNSIDTERLFLVCEILGKSIYDMYAPPHATSPPEKEKTVKSDGLSEAQRKLIAFAQTVPEDKAELVLRVMRSILEDD
jgi:transcriptional regulator with XRE-family HTH domain